MNRNAKFLDYLRKELFIYKRCSMMNMAFCIFLKNKQDKTNILIDKIKQYKFFPDSFNIPHKKKRDTGGEDSYKICCDK